MRIARGMDELTRLESANLRNHHCQERVGCDIERHAEKSVGTALIQLAGQFAFRNVKLEKAMTRRKRHLVHLARIPR